MVLRTVNLVISKGHMLDTYLGIAGNCMGIEEDRWPKYLLAHRNPMIHLSGQMFAALMYTYE